MTPLQAWEATTRVAAELLGVNGDHGTLEPGKVATSSCSRAPTTT